MGMAWPSLARFIRSRLIAVVTHRERRHHCDSLTAALGRQQIVEGVDLGIERGDIRVAGATGGRLARRHRLIERCRIGAACRLMVASSFELTAYGRPVRP